MKLSFEVEYISVKDKLPKEGEKVLIYGDNTFYVGWIDDIESGDL